ncbi:MAG: hypothetical protein ACREEM_50570 [Blastocatellia bacterium]
MIDAARVARPEPVVETSNRNSKLKIQIAAQSDAAQTCAPRKKIAKTPRNAYFR